MTANWTDSKLRGSAQARVDGLLRAISAGRLSEVRKVLAIDDDRRPYILGMVEDFSSGLLSSAVEADNVEMVALLLDAGFNIERTAGTRANWSRFPTPAFEASARGQVEMVRYLVERGADINARNPASGCTMLMEALSKKNTGMALALIEMGIRYGGEVTDNNGSAAINYAASTDNVEVYMHLCDKGVLDDTEWNRLSFAISYLQAHKIVAACLSHPMYRQVIAGPEGMRVINACNFMAHRAAMLSARTEDAVKAAVDVITPDAPAASPVLSRSMLSL